MADWTYPDDFVELIRQACRENQHLKKDKYWGKNEYAGMCYIASEAYYHLVGGDDSNWRPAYIYCGSEENCDQDTHWFLVDKEAYERGLELVESGAMSEIDIKNYILDLTPEQFEEELAYFSFNFCGFLTRQPSRRAQIIMDWVLNEI